MGVYQVKDPTSVSGMSFVREVFGLFGSTAAVCIGISKKPHTYIYIYIFFFKFFIFRLTLLLMYL